MFQAEPNLHIVRLWDQACDRRGESKRIRWPDRAVRRAGSYQKRTTKMQDHHKRLSGHQLAQRHVHG